VSATIFFLFLITVLVTLFDRYQPYLVIREAIRDGGLDRARLMTPASRPS
jgi:hypothetical protein